MQSKEGSREYPVIYITRKQKEAAKATSIILIFHLKDNTYARLV